MVSLLRSLIKNSHIPLNWVDEQLQTNREVLNKVLRRLLQPMTFIQNLCAGSGYYNVLCADGDFRRAKLVLAAWLAECPEYGDLHHVERHFCFWCECRKNELGDYIYPDLEQPPAGSQPI